MLAWGCDQAIRLWHVDRSAEVRKRVASLLGLPRIVPPGECLRGFRALQVLEHIGRAEARELLKHLAGGAPEALRTQEAKAALERFARGYMRF